MIPSTIPLPMGSTHSNMFTKSLDIYTYLYKVQTLAYKAIHDLVPTNSDFVSSHSPTSHSTLATLAS